MATPAPPPRPPPAVHPPALPIPAAGAAPDGDEHMTGPALAALAAKAGLEPYAGPAWVAPPDGPPVNDRDMRVGDRSAPPARRPAVVEPDRPDRPAPPMVKRQPGEAPAPRPPRPPKPPREPTPDRSARSGRSGRRPLKREASGREGSPSFVPEFTLPILLGAVRRTGVLLPPPASVGGFAGRKAAKAAIARARATLRRGTWGRSKALPAALAPHKRTPAPPPTRPYPVRDPNPTRPPSSRVRRTTSASEEGGGEWE
jgi:hypothetical protein